MCTEIKAPNDFLSVTTEDDILIFLGGSIEMGIAPDWQKKMQSAFKRTANVVLLNPRRDNWNASWKQTKTNKKFREQVEWELSALGNANVVILYFDPSTKAPITLLELGLFADTGRDRLVVVCPTGYWRKGNVDIVCERYDIPQFASLKAATTHIKDNINFYRISG